MSPLRLSGSSSGFSQLDAPAVAGDQIFTLPGTGGTIDRLNRAGNVLQVVRATDTTDRAASTGGFVDTGMSVTITPTSASNSILIIASVFASFNPGGTSRTGLLKLTNASNVDISGAQQVNFAVSSANELSASQILIGYNSPSTTSAVTYKLRFTAFGGGTITLVNAQNTGQMFALEIAS